MTVSLKDIDICVRKSYNHEHLDIYHLPSNCYKDHKKFFTVYIINKGNYNQWIKGVIRELARNLYSIQYAYELEKLLN